MRFPSVGSLLNKGWTMIRLGRHADALKLYREVIGVAPANTIELRAALLGAAVLHAINGDDDEAEANMEACEAMRPRGWHQQLFTTIEDVLNLWYVRRTIYWNPPAPKRFNPKKLHTGANQGVIVGAVWRENPYSYLNRSSRICEVYNLRKYDPPYAWHVFIGGDRRPFEAVTPLEVLAATDCVESAKYLEAIAV